jgi:hypothetical protein
MVELEIKTLPNLDDIQLIDFERISDEVAATVPACNRFKGIIFIIADIGGVGDHAELIVEVIRGTPLQDMLMDFVEGYEDKTWDELATSAIEIMGIFASAEFVSRCYSRLGSPVAAAMLKRFSLILVPYLGEIYGAIVVLAAIKNNWDLIAC